MPIRAIKGKTYKGVSELYRKSDDVTTGYYITYRDEDSNVRKVRVDAQNREDALLLLNQRKHEVKRVKELSYEKIIEHKMQRVTLDTVYEQWIDTVTPQSKRQYTSLYTKHLQPTLGKKIINDIRLLDGENIITTLTKEKYSAQTQNGVIAVGKIIINWAIRHDMAKVNGLAHVKRKKLDNNRMRLLTKEQIMELIGKADEQLGFFMTMLFYTAQRPASVIKLQKKHIREGSIHFAPIKSQDWNVLPIHADLEEQLEKWIESLDDSDYLFHKPWGANHTPISYRNLAHRAKKLFEPLNKGLDAREDRKIIASLYTIRHSSATIILSSTGNQRLVQSILNHAGSEMTAKYAKILDNAKKEGLDAL